MWAIIENGIVIDYFIGSKDEVTKLFNDKIIIEMTPENSPAYLGGTWDGFKFYQKEIIDG